MVTIIGGGLAGSEAAWQVAARGVRVALHEMRPLRATAVHKTDQLAELVCSNSFRGDKLDNAVGLLKEEMRRLGSLVMRAAEESRVPAGAALAVDRDRFAQTITRALTDHPLVTIVRDEVSAIPPSSEREPVIIATGPLTSDALAADIAALVGSSHLYFYDAISPIVLAETIDRSKVFRASRWDRSLRGSQGSQGSRGSRGSEGSRGSKGSRGSEGSAGSHDVGLACGVDDGAGDYLNCPMTRGEYDAFYEALVSAESATVHDFDKEKFFEGCLPIEVMAHRGRDTLRFGPMKPVGLIDPRTGREPYACVQLRQDNLAGDHFSLVGFQTQIKWGEQARVLRMIPGLEQAEFVRFGMVHRNTYVNGPTGTRRDLAGAAAADAVLCRPDVGRGRLRRISGIRPDCRAQCHRAQQRPGGCGAAAHDRDRRAWLLRIPRQPGTLSALEHHLRHHAAAGQPAQGKAIPKSRIVRARARRFAELD